MRIFYFNQTKFNLFLTKWKLTSNTLKFCFLYLFIQFDMLVRFWTVSAKIFVVV